MPVSCKSCGHENPIQNSSCANCNNKLDNNDILVELAHMDIKLGKIKEGIQTLKDLGEVYIKEDNFEEVERIVKDILSIQPNDIDSHNLMGEMYLKTDELEQAEKSFRKVLVYDLSNIKALVKLGETFDKKGDRESAIIAYRKVIKFNENAPEPYEFLAKIELDKGNKQEAISYYKKLTEIYKACNNTDKYNEFNRLHLELAGTKPSGSLYSNDDSDDDMPPPEDMEVMGLHLPALELSFGDEQDPFAPSFDTPPAIVKNRDKEKNKIKKLNTNKLQNKTEVYLKILEEHPDYNKRYLAVLNLNTNYGAKVVTALEKALKDENRLVRTQAAIILGATGDKKAIPNLIEAIEKDDDSSIRQHGVSLLGELGEERGIDTLIKALKDKDSSVRKAAVMSLGRFQDPRIIEPLIEYLDKADSSMWPTIINIIAPTGDNMIVRPVIKIFEKTQKIELKINIISIFNDYSDPILFEFFIKALKDSNNKIKIGAVKALGKLGNRKAIIHLEKLLTEKDDELCRETQETLNRLGYKPSPFSKIKSFFWKKR